MHYKTPHFRHGIRHKVRAGVAITLFTGAFLLTSGIFTRAYSQEKERKPKGGDSTLLMQTSPGQVLKPVEQAKKDTTKKMDTVPKLVIPDVRTLEHYMPYFMTDSMFTSTDPKVRRKVQWRADTWRTEDDAYPPFGLTRRVLDSYSKQDREELERRWTVAKTELIVAFLSDKGATPSNALKVHTPEEVKDMLRRWQNLKGIDEKMHELMLRPSVQPKSK